MSKLWFVCHGEDEWCDEVRLEGTNEPVLRCIVRYRYKTSGLSGDEWRTGARWEQWMGDCWQDFNRGSHRLSDALGFLYGGVYQDHPELHDTPITSIGFYRKGKLLRVSTHDGNAKPLLVVLGHLPWAWVKSMEEGMGDGFPDNDEYCFQPGCPERAVATYKRLKDYCNKCGEGKERPNMPGKWGYARRFCQIHLSRGNCGLDDADANYEVLEGPGPSEAKGWSGYESKSQFAGTIHLDL